jgi:hypothetical protein
MVYVIVDSFRRRQQLRVMGEFHNKLLDRVGTAGELVEFFSTESLICASLPRRAARTA